LDTERNIQTINIDENKNKRRERINYHKYDQYNDGEIDED
jgi:hypothetical protein